MFKIKSTNHQRSCLSEKPKSNGFFFPVFPIFQQALQFYFQKSPLQSPLAPPYFKPPSSLPMTTATAS